MPSALSIIGAAALLAIGGAAVAAYDRHPPLSWHAHVLFWSPGFDLPGGPVTQAQQQAAAALAASRMAQDGQKRCDASLFVQNASLAQAEQKGAAAVASAQRALDATQAQNTRLWSAAASLAAFPTMAMAGETACQRWDRADGAVIAALMVGR